MTSSGLKLGDKRHVCSYCERDSSKTVRIICIECQNFELCGDCFSVGVELYPHKNSHKYRVADCLSFPVFHKDWTAREELDLLRGIERFGAGNWKTIADALGTGKTGRQLEEHYWERYMGRFGHCLPINTLMHDSQHVHTHELIAKDKDLTNAYAYNGIDMSATADHIPIYGTHARGDTVLRDAKLSNQHASNGPLIAPADSQSQSQGNGSAAKKGTGLGATGSVQCDAYGRPLMPGHDLPGFMPLREDFDVEYDNDAELLLADMEFNDNDHPSEVELKTQVLRIYHAKLAEREKRKRFVIDRGLVDFKAVQAVERRRSKEERDLVARMRIFQRFQTQKEHESLVEGLLKARRLRKQIELYSHYRRMGVRTLDQARIYESDRKRKEAEQKSKRQREDTPYLFQTGQGSKDSLLHSHGSSSSVNSSSSSSSSSSGSSGRRGGSPRGDDKSLDTRSEAPGIDMTKAQGYNALQDVEKKLVTDCGIMPMHFLAAKSMVIVEAMRNGVLSKDGVRRTVDVEVMAPGKSKVALVDYFVRTVPQGDVAASSPMKKMKQSAE